MILRGMGDWIYGRGTDDGSGYANGGWIDTEWLTPQPLYVDTDGDPVYGYYTDDYGNQRPAHWITADIDAAYNTPGGAYFERYAWKSLDPITGQPIPGIKPILKEYIQRWEKQYLHTYGEPMNRPWDYDADSAAAGNSGVLLPYLLAMREYNVATGNHAMPECADIRCLPVSKYAASLPAEHKDSAGVVGEAVNFVKDVFVNFVAPSAALYGAVVGASSILNWVTNTIMPPSLPSAPDLPSIPDAPAPLPDIPDIPDVPSIPDTPAPLPDIPDVPELPVYNDLPVPAPDLTDVPFPSDAAQHAADDFIDKIYSTPTNAPFPVDAARQAADNFISKVYSAPGITSSAALNTIQGMLTKAGLTAAGTVATSLIGQAFHSATGQYLTPPAGFHTLPDGQIAPLSSTDQTGMVMLAAGALLLIAVSRKGKTK